MRSPIPKPTDRATRERGSPGEDGRGQPEKGEEPALRIATAPGAGKGHSTVRHPRRVRGQSRPGRRGAPREGVGHPHRWEGHHRRRRPRLPGRPQGRGRAGRALILHLPPNRKEHRPHHHLLSGLKRGVPSEEAGRQREESVDGSGRGEQHLAPVEEERLLGRARWTPAPALPRPNHAEV